MSLDLRQEMRNAVEASLRKPTPFPEPPIAWFDDGLSAWAMKRCVFRDRAWGGINALHRDYVRWCTEDAKEIPCSRERFSEWLSWEGFRLQDHGLVYGLILQADLDAL